MRMFFHFDGKYVICYENNHTLFFVTFFQIRNKRKHQIEALRGSFDILNEGNSGEEGEHNEYLHNHNSSIGLNPAYFLTHGFNNTPINSFYAPQQVFTSAELLKLSKGNQLCEFIQFLFCFFF